MVVNHSLSMDITSEKASIPSVVKRESYARRSTNVPS